MFTMILGGIAGAAMGLLQGFMQKKQADRQYKLAQQQFDMQRQQYEKEEQERNKMRQKEVDLDGLVAQSTEEGLGKTNLTGPRGARVITPLNKKNSLLGV